MEITEHSIDNYIRRIIGVNPEQAGQSIRERARDRIEETVNNPECTYKDSGEKYPIEIKGPVAVPVGRDPDGSRYVPTTYRSDTFTNRGNNK